MLDPKDPCQGRDQLARLVTEKMLHHLGNLPRWWHSIRGFGACRRHGFQPQDRSIGSSTSIDTRLSAGIRLRRWNITHSRGRIALRPFRGRPVPSSIQAPPALLPPWRRTPRRGSPWRSPLPRPRYPPEARSTRRWLLSTPRTDHLPPAGPF